MIQLTENYRSHEEIVNIFSDLFYENSLTAVASKKHSTLCNISILKDKKFPVVFHSVVTGREEKSEKMSTRNFAEADLVLKYVDFLKKTYRIKDEDIGIIAPYTFQGDLIKRKLGKRSNIVVGSVEKFQGSEKRVIIITTVRSGNDLGFMNEDERFNTAISRAKELLIVIGNEYTLSKQKKWKRYVLKSYQTH